MQISRINNAASNMTTCAAFVGGTIAERTLQKWSAMFELGDFNL